MSKIRPPTLAAFSFVRAVGVQKTLVFCTAVNALEVSYLAYVADSTETREVR